MRTARLRLVCGDLGADHRLPFAENRQYRGQHNAIVAFGIDLDVGKLRPPVGKFRFKHREQISTADDERMLPPIESPTLLRLEAAVAETVASHPLYDNADNCPQRASNEGGCNRGHRVRMMQ
jgi:hypothetical protein